MNKKNMYQPTITISYYSTILKKKKKNVFLALFIMFNADEMIR